MFAREVTPGLTSLVKKLDAAAAAYADQKLGALVILFYVLTIVKMGPAVFTTRDL